MLVVGLGNPGSRYRDTWHNLGFLALEAWAAQKKLEFKPGRGDYYRLTCPARAGKITFLKATSYMNLSGVPVSRYARYLRVPPEQTLVVCDDVALPFGTLRLRQSGSAGGHKGLASVIGEMGSEQIPRLRIGCWTGSWPGDLADYVLSPIPANLYAELRKMLSLCAEALECIFSEGFGRAMNRYNRNFLADEAAASTE